MVIFAAVGGRMSLLGAVYGALLVNFGKTLFSESFPELWLFLMGGAVHRGGDGSSRTAWPACWEDYVQRADRARAGWHRANRNPARRHASPTRAAGADAEAGNQCLIES